MFKAMLIVAALTFIPFYFGMMYLVQFLPK